MRRRSALPIVVASARHEPAGKIALLDAGADDYLVKPFSIDELLARIRVALRHRGSALQPALRQVERDGVVIDLDTRRVARDGVPVHLTPTEFRAACAPGAQRRPDRHPRQLLADVWGAEHVDDITLRLYMDSCAPSSSARRQSRASAYEIGAATGSPSIVQEEGAGRALCVPDAAPSPSACIASAPSP